MYLQKLYNFGESVLRALLWQLLSNNIMVFNSILADVLNNKIVVYTSNIKLNLHRIFAKSIYVKRVSKEKLLAKSPGIVPT